VPPRGLKEELGSSLCLESRTFTPRPPPAAAVPFTGTHRQESWRRCGALTAADGISAGVQAIPTVVLSPTRRRLVGLADPDTYRSVVGSASR
jgi:hypothetical protein